MERATEASDRIDAANALLAIASPHGARWWSYTASLRTFELVVGAPNSADNLVIVLADCISIVGPVDWGTQQLRVRFEVSMIDGVPRYVFELYDDSVGFNARSNMFTFKQGWDLLEK